MMNSRKIITRIAGAIIVGLLAGCVVKQISTMPPVNKSLLALAAAQMTAAPVYLVKWKLSWRGSSSPNVAYYEIQQTTNILSQIFFDETNVVGTNVFVATTNQSGTWRIRAVNTWGLASTWTYLSR